jgi:hypothetical protein
MYGKTVPEQPLDELNEIAAVGFVRMFAPLFSMLSSPKDHVSSLHQNHSMSEM